MSCRLIPCRDRKEAKLQPFTMWVWGAQGTWGRGAQPTRPDTNASVFRRPPPPRPSHLSLFQLSWKNEELKANSQEMKLQPAVSPWARGSPFLPTPQYLTPWLTLHSTTPDQPLPHMGQWLGMLPHSNLATTMLQVAAATSSGVQEGSSNALSSPLHTTHGHMAAFKAKERINQSHPFF